MKIERTVNGERRSLDVDARTVLSNGRRINSCLTLACMHDKDDITTKGAGTAGAPLQEAFIRHDGFQRGYCAPGQICPATAMRSFDYQSAKTFADVNRSSPETAHPARG